MSASDQDHRTIDEQAALWLVRVSAPEVSDQDIMDLTDWLEASEAHGRAFDRVEAVWQAAQGLISDGPTEDGLGLNHGHRPQSEPDWVAHSKSPAGADPNSETGYGPESGPMTGPNSSPEFEAGGISALPDNKPVDLSAYRLQRDQKVGRARKAPASRQLGLWAFGAIAAGLAGLFILPSLLVTPARPMLYQTDKGQTRQIQLADGTRLNLNSDTRIEVRLGRTTRDVRLVRGELALAVVHDARRPFTVTAGETRLQDLGTEFNVLKRADAIVLTVRSGRVSVLSPGNQSPFAGRGPTDGLGAGDQAIISNSSGKIIQRKVNLATAYAWQNHQAIYEDVSLADVVLDLNRYFKKPLVVDARTGQLMVTAVINLDSEASVVKRLQAFLPIEATTADDAITLRQRH